MSGSGIILYTKRLGKIQYLVIGKLTMYFAETDQNPVLKPNPTSGIIEHINYQWLEGSDMYKDCFIWLKPFIKWIRNKQL